jgi:CubicO group peptidase (beta-lactamase class C family)
VFFCNIRWRLLPIRQALFLALILTETVVLLSCAVSAKRTIEAPVQAISDRKIAALVQAAMQQFDSPGMAIGIVHRGQSVYAQGHGLREIGDSAAVDTQTLFKIASNTKAFTAAALAILVDEGRLEWDGRVADYLPQFRLSDPWVTDHFNVADLLTHRSGLPRFAGDLMFWPEPNEFTHDDIIHALQYFELEGGFRTEYAYDNLLYVVAGQLVPAVTGQSWGDFIDERIMRSLSMRRCFAGPIPDTEFRNVAAPHGRVEGELQVVERSRIGIKPPVSAAAGGIVCSLNDMLTWVKTQLGRGLGPGGEHVFSEQQSRAMWRPYIWRSVSEQQTEEHGTHFSAYGLGWRLRDFHGFKEVSHTGSLAGMLSYVVLVPELELGLVVLSNGSDSAARSVVMETLLHAYLDMPPTDYLARRIEAEREAQQGLPHELRPAAVVTDLLVPFEPGRADEVAGVYEDPWFGRVHIISNTGNLYFRAEKSMRLKGPIRALSDGRFLVQWEDRSVESDALISFVEDPAGPMRILMTRVDPLSERSLDFQDLNLVRLEP